MGGGSLVQNIPTKMDKNIPLPHELCLCRSVCVCVCVFVCLSACLSVCLSACLSVSLSLSLSLCLTFLTFVSSTTHLSAFCRRFSKISAPLLLSFNPTKRKRNEKAINSCCSRSILQKGEKTKKQF